MSDEPTATYANVRNGQYIYVADPAGRFGWHQVVEREGNLMVTLQLSVPDDEGRRLTLTKHHTAKVAIREAGDFPPV